MKKSPTELPAPSLVPLPLVRAAAGRSWSQVYHDADMGRLGPVTRIGSRLYLDHDSALAYLARVRPDDGPAALEDLLRPATIGRAR